SSRRVAVPILFPIGSPGRGPQRHQGLVPSESLMSENANASSSPQSTGHFFSTPISLRDLLQTVPDVVFGCDADGRWMWLNPAIETLVGYKPADLLGHPCTGLVAASERRAFMKTFFDMKRKRVANVVEHDFAVMSSEGKKVRVAARV